MTGHRVSFVRVGDVPGSYVVLDLAQPPGRRVIGHVTKYGRTWAASNAAGDPMQPDFATRRDAALAMLPPGGDQ